MSETLTPGGISFAEVPYDWRVPGTYVEVRADHRNRGVSAFPTRVLLLGTAQPGGTAAPGQAYRITRDDQAPALFGPASTTAEMVAAFRTANRTNDLWAVALADPGGATAAAGSVAFSGPGVSASTQIVFYVGGRRVRFVQRPADTPTAAAAAFAAAVNADPACPLSAAATAASVALTAKWPGALGNDLLVAPGDGPDESLPPGLAATVTAPTGGAGAPDLAAALAAFAAEWFTDLVVPWSDAAALSALDADLARRFAAMGRLDAHAWVGLRATFGGATAKAGPQNSPLMTFLPAKGSRSSPWAWAASLAGVAAFHLTTDPARQLRGLALPGLHAPAPRDRFSPQEQDLLLRSGCSTWEATPDGAVVLQRVVTARQRTPLGAADAAWLDVMVPKTLTRIRHDWSEHVTLLYPRCKLAHDGSAAARAGSDAVVTPGIMHGSWAARLALYERLGWVEDARWAAENSLFERDGSDRNRMNARQSLRVVGNLMVLAAALEFRA